MGGMRARHLAAAGTEGWPGRSLRVAASAAAVALAVALAGCGSLTPGGSGPAGASQHARPAAGSRAAALALDRQLLSRLVLPPGARRARLRLVPRWLRPPGEDLGAARWPSIHRLFVLGQRMRAAERFFVAHPPARMKVDGTSETGSRRGVTSQAVSYTLRSLPPGIYRAGLDVTVVPDRHGGSFLRADAQAIWYPRRSAAEHLSPAGFGAVTVAVRMRLSRPHQVTRTFTSRKVIAGLTALLNGLPAAPDLEEPCPEEFASYRVAFTRSAGTRPAVVVTSGACLTDQVTVGGKAQPALAGSGKLGAAVSRLLGTRTRP
jgi:hypothetical protein